MIIYAGELLAVTLTNLFKICISHEYVPTFVSQLLCLLLKIKMVNMMPMKIIDLSL